MERSCGDLDNRLKKKCDLNAVSRESILKGTAALREKNEINFHNMNRTIKIIDNSKAEWSEHQKDLAAAGLNYREAGLLVTRSWTAGNGS